MRASVPLACGHGASRASLQRDATEAQQAHAVALILQHSMAGVFRVCALCALHTRPHAQPPFTPLVATQSPRHSTSRSIKSDKDRCAQKPHEEAVTRAQSCWPRAHASASRYQCPHWPRHTHTEPPMAFARALCFLSRQHAAHAASTCAAKDTHRVATAVKASTPTTSYTLI
jgi:hypothetical protein